MSILKVSRVEGLMDGIFAIAMTILVLDLRLPQDVLSSNLSTILNTTVIFKLFIYIASFVILGTLWVAMNFQMGLLKKVNRPYLWTVVFFLMAVCVVPFSASLVAKFPENPASVTFYVFNLLCGSLGQLLTLECSHHFQLNGINTDAIRYAAIKRVLVAPAFYVAALILVNWHPRIAFILLIIPTVVYIIPGRIDKYNRD